MPPEGFACKRCGKCCMLRGAYQNYAAEEDFQRWQLEGRNDILQFTAVNDLGFDMQGDARRVINIWVKPGTEEYVESCPWLNKSPDGNGYLCAIHETKPWHCRSFPSSKEFAENIGCEGFRKH